MSRRCHILIFSDVPAWLGYKKLVSHHKPQIVLLAGDVTSDGFAKFWKEAFERIPAFRRKRKGLAKGFGVVIRASGLFEMKPSTRSEKFWDELEALKDQYLDSGEFHAARRALQVAPFFDFLRFAGKTARVFVVKGDHDDDFPDDYDRAQIDCIHGCMEISGKLVEAHGLRFLGLGFNETHYKRSLREYVNRFVDKVDVVVAHSEQSRVPILSELRPRLIVRGHFGFGRFLVSGIPSVLTGGIYYSLVDFGSSIRIVQYRQPLGTKSRPSKFEGANCRPWRTDRSEFELYPRLKPYHAGNRAKKPGNLAHSVRIDPLG